MAREISKEQLGESLRELVLEKLAEKAAARDRSTTKSRLQAEAIELLGERIGALDLWTRVPPPGRKPRLSRDDLAAAALRIADEEGMSALSMRRLASELDVGTMTLYHYVHTKDELLSVVMDAVMAEVVVPEGTAMPTRWRDAITLIARRSHDAFVRHPWTLDIADDPPIGPNTVRHFDQSLQALASLDVPLVEKLDIVALVDEYVFGYSLFMRNNTRSDFADQDSAIRDYISVLIETGAYPQLSALAASTGLDAVWDAVRTTLRNQARFERNLRRILDGVEVDLAKPNSRQ